MANDFQIVVDSADPHTQADWWAEALNWDVEPSDEAFIQRMIDAGHASEDDVKTHNGVRVWKDGHAIRKPGTPDGEKPRRILFQLVPEAKTVKNRLHIDVWVGEDRVAAEVERLVAAGATVLHVGHQGPHSWTTMTDPEGNEFCVS